MRTDYWKARISEGAVLSPVDRISEVLFGLIMVLTFTGAISVTSDGREEVRSVLWAALGCNLAWGIVDAVMYWMNVLLERGHGLKSIQQIRSSRDPQMARDLLRAEIQPVMASLLTDQEVDQLTERITKLPEPEPKHILTARDILSGVQIFLLVFLCTLPVALPFAFISELPRAMRVSNGIALLMLFVGGYKLAWYAGFRPWLTAVAYAIIGVVLVGLTMALGG
ncbi:MAG: VIT1/CCC1 transporter family protein [Cyclobacteriaceae bacterium]|nr:VIT1/CCC1 transporter family protein [Cyclobacteriaceae bacterium]